VGLFSDRSASLGFGLEIGVAMGATCNAKWDIQLFRCASAAVGGQGRKIQPQSEKQLCAAGHAMSATVLDSEAVESFDGQRPREHEPGDHQTVGMMMADVFEVMMVFGFVEPLVSISSGSWPCGIATAEPTCRSRKIRQPIGLHHLPSGLCCRRNKQADGFQRRRPSRDKVVGVPDLYAIFPYPKTTLGGWERKRC